MIYCVEDDEDIRNLMTYTIRASGFEVKGFSSGEALWKELNQLASPELILLDIMLPGEDGLSILHQLKYLEKTKTIPVIMTTAKGTEYDKVIGLDQGADDYLVKPFGMMEMMARIKAVLRRSKNSEQKKDFFNGDIHLDSVRHAVYIKDKVLDLTLKEYDLLFLFLTHLDQAFGREVLLNKVWGMDFIGESRTVDVHIGTLRTKLGDDGSLIETVRGIGYKMVKANEEKNI